MKIQVESCCETALPGFVVIVILRSDYRVEFGLEVIEFLCNRINRRPLAVDVPSRGVGWTGRSRGDRVDELK